MSNGEGVFLDPQKVAEQAADDQFLADVEEELKPDFKRLQNLVRGNQRLEQELAPYGIQVQPFNVTNMRLNMALDILFGEPKQSRARLDFEIAFAEAMRSDLGKAKLSIPGSVN